MKKPLIIAIFTVFSLLTFQPVKAAVNYGDLVKGSGPTVYFVTNDLKRLAFPDEQVFLTWYAGFGSVRAISDADLTKLPFAGLVPLRPGIRPIKGATDSRVYAVDRDGKLRWLSTEAVARVIYGADWSRKLAVVSDAQLADYGRGADVTGPNQYWWMAERDASPNLQEVRLRRLASTPAPTPVKPASGVILASAPAPSSRIVIIPKVINDNGGRALEGDLELFIGPSRVMPQEVVNVEPGAHTLYRVAPAGYTVSAWSNDCTPEGVVDVPAGLIRACFITIDDIPDNLWGSQSNRPPSLKLSAKVINTRGGRLTDKDVQLFIGNMQVASGFYSVIKAEDYTVYRVIPPGYTASVWSGDCTPQGTVSLRNGEEKSCLITFRD